MAFSSGCLVGRGLRAPPPTRRSEDCYRRNGRGYGWRRASWASTGHGLGRRAMSEDAGRFLVERGRSAATHGDWQEAFDLLMQADAEGLMAPSDLPVLAETAYAAGQLDV